jgi:hypothetical protein
MASGIKQKKNTEDSRCRYGCDATKSMYHVFVVCGKFKVLRGGRERVITEEIGEKIQRVQSGGVPRNGTSGSS